MGYIEYKYQLKRFTSKNVFTKWRMAEYQINECRVHCILWLETGKNNY